ncbi:MAG: helix-turn-helix domain-containing protein [Candidatus Hodarchaeales archaeon]|jgi:predicted DNA binding protein
MLYNFLLEIQHDCPFSRFSQKHPKIEMQLWCNAQNDILELRGEKNILGKALKDLDRELGTVVKIYPEPDQVQLVLRRCKCNQLPLSPIYNKYDCLELPPVKYFSGREIVNIIVTPEDAGKILEDIRKEVPGARVKVLKLAPLKITDNPYPLYLPVDELKGNLTVKQLQALKIAFKKGYYELPRNIILEELAEEMEIHRRTYEEHLRKAERKVMTLLMPSLML